MNAKGLLGVRGGKNQPGCAEMANSLSLDVGEDDMDLPLEGVPEELNNETWSELE